MQAGQAHGIRPFGVEAQRLLRLEKGHIIIGQDTDGLTTPFEAAMDWAVKMDKPFFVGQRSLKIIEKRRASASWSASSLDQTTRARRPRNAIWSSATGQIAGRVTSIAFSPSLGRHIGLAFVPPDMAAEGTRFIIRADGGQMVEARVVPDAVLRSGGRAQKAADMNATRRSPLHDLACAAAAVGRSCTACRRRMRASAGEMRRSSTRWRWPI